MTVDALNLLPQVFGEFSDDEIESVLLPLVYEFASQRLGEQETQKLFRRLGSRKYAIDNATTLLLLNYVMRGQRNKSEFLRKRVAHNKTLPPSQQRGAGSTNINHLRRYLDRALKENRAFLARPDIALMHGDPDLADWVMQTAEKKFDEHIGQISEKKS